LWVREPRWTDWPLLVERVCQILRAKKGLARNDAMINRVKGYWEKQGGEKKREMGV
jgi:hypothetical protein